MLDRIIFVFLHFFMILKNCLKFKCKILGESSSQFRIRSELEEQKRNFPPNGNDEKPAKTVALHDDKNGREPEGQHRIDTPNAQMSASALEEGGRKYRRVWREASALASKAFSTNATQKSDHHRHSLGRGESEEDDESIMKLLQRRIFEHYQSVQFL